MIFPPQVALLAIGAPKLRPWVVDGAVVPRRRRHLDAVGRPPRQRRQAGRQRSSPKSMRCFKYRRTYDTARHPRSFPGGTGEGRPGSGPGMPSATTITSRTTWGSTRWTCSTSWPRCIAGWGSTSRKRIIRDRHPGACRVLSGRAGEVTGNDQIHPNCVEDERNQTKKEPAPCRPTNPKGSTISSAAALPVLPRAVFLIRDAGVVGKRYPDLRTTRRPRRVAGRLQRRRTRLRGPRRPDVRRRISPAPSTCSTRSLLPTIRAHGQRGYPGLQQDGARLIQLPPRA